MHFTLTFALLLSGSLYLASPIPVQAQTPLTGSSAGTFVYKPPLRGAPARRVGGATRGSGDTGLVLNVLAPDHTGLTSRAQPKLYWYASKPSTSSIEVTVIADTAETPILTKKLAATPGGVQSIDLAANGITLAPDTVYEWFVSLVTDSRQRSKDLTSSGTIRLAAADPAMMARVAAAGERGAPEIYAEAGLWYDAITALSSLIERYPADTALRGQRAALLDQIGLPVAAAHDR